MNARSVDPLRYAAGLLALLASLASAATPAHADSICRECYQTNDTTSSGGIVATPRLLLGIALAPPVTFLGAGGRVHCATSQGTSWEVEVVDSSSAGGCSIELDAMGTIAVAYHDVNSRLLWARRLATGWLRQPIDATSMVSGRTSMARVPAGLAIAYVDADTGRLMFAEQGAGGTWHVEAVAPLAGSEAFPSLVADGALRAISYYDPTHRDLRLARRGAGGAWTSMVIDSAGDVGGYTSLVGGPSHGGFGIAYHDFTNADLRYAHEIDGTWSVETIDGAGVAVGRFAAAVPFGGSAADRVGVTYHDQTHGDLKYAFRQLGQWAITTLDTTGVAGAPSFAGGTQYAGDTLGVVYVERTSGDLLYLRRAGAVTAAPPSTPLATPLRVTWTRGAERPGGTVRFTVPRAGEVRVEIHDLLGRRVAVPWREALPSGPAEVHWDGRDDRSRPVGAGTYFVRVTVPGTSGGARAPMLR